MADRTRWIHSTAGLLTECKTFGRTQMNKWIVRYYPIQTAQLVFRFFPIWNLYEIFVYYYRKRKKYRIHYQYIKEEI